ncbi:Trk system potassium transporter TrkA [Azohydromonas aeria]|uniref:Trk system potassium transporter TrkA n=1 Tax=Azohydromonas aeria TaxID=2590212 RepID=UPI0012FC6583|nr:Trk system potassium transporter TrkA [Azohydromonas aeria]
MNIVILGAGRVGESVAESLASEANDITVIDTDPARLALLQDRLDLRGVAGNGIQPSVLLDAGIGDADLFIACAQLDESNLVACKVARQLFNVPTTIARLRSPEFQEGMPLTTEREGFGVDRVICPEESVMRSIWQLIRYPEALQVLELAQGLLSLVAVRAVAGGPLVGHRLDEIPKLVPGADMRMVAIYRQDKAVADVCGSTCIEPGDEVFVLSPSGQLRRVLGALRERDRPVRRIMIAGGGRVGLRLARQLRGEVQVKIIEVSRGRCDYLATQLPGDVLVLNGDSTDEDLLGDENVQDMDLFLALTSDDEDNIMACLLAKRMGARHVLALINRKAYADLVQGTTIDIALSPAQAVIGELLAHVRWGNVEAVHSLRHGTAEVLEAVVSGDAGTSKLVGRRIDQIPLPAGAQIGAIVRGLPDPHEGGEPRREERGRGGRGGLALRRRRAASEVEQARIVMAHHDTEVLAGDHLIVFLPNKKQVREVQRLFQVSPLFL